MSEETTTADQEETTTADQEATDPAPKKATKKTTKKKSSPKKAASVKGMTKLQAIAAAIKDGQVVPLEGAMFVVPLSLITSNENPRNEPAYLCDPDKGGYVLVGSDKDLMTTDIGTGESYTEADLEEYQPDLKSLLHMALSEDNDIAQRYVDLIEMYENVDRKELPHAPQSIVELARDVNLAGQLVPVYVKKQGKGYVLYDGGRRTAAVLYLYAKSRIQRANKEDDAPSKVFSPVLLASELDCSKDELWHRSVMINLSRKDFNELQEGKIYDEMSKRTNPTTGKKFTLKEVAEQVAVPYGTVRNRQSLWRPYQEATKDEEGNIVKPSKGLTDADRQKLANNEITATSATRKALGEQHYSSDGAPQPNRRKPIPLKELEKRFDETATNNVERRKAFAEAMGFVGKKGFDKANKESEARIDKQDELDLKNSAAA